MDVATRLWVTPHGVKKLEGERAHLRGWLERWGMRLAKDEDSQGRDIDLLLSEKRVVEDRLKRVEAVLDRTCMLPPGWSHKDEARAGDTVYLRHHDSIRAITLVSVWGADPVNGKVSVVSPIGRALLGRHAGDHIRLQTLDGEVAYEILKVV
jgi:transcription elongation factor GreA